MRYLWILLLAIYRVWFYVLVLIPIVALAPILLISISYRRFYPFFYKLARIWAAFILYGMLLPPKVKRMYKLEKGKSYVFVANHTSMADIMLMLYISPNPFVFVGKKELARIPVFGFFYRNTSILVDRANAQSRKEVFDQAQQRLSNGLSVGIFPEGHVPEGEVLLDLFKDGAFRLAIEHQIPIVPMTFIDNGRRFSYNLLKDIGPGVLRAVVHKPIDTRGMTLANKKELNRQARQIILQELEQYVTK